MGEVRACASEPVHRPAGHGELVNNRQRAWLVPFILRAQTGGGAGLKIP